MNSQISYLVDARRCQVSLVCDMGLLQGHGSLTWLLWCAGGKSILV